MLIAGKFVVNKDKKSANLLVEYLLSPLEKSLKSKTGELKPRGQPCKNIIPVAKPFKEGKAGKKTRIKDFANGKNGNVDKFA